MTDTSPNTNTAPICPTCGGFIPNNEHPGKYPGALSRRDNRTEICSACGLNEALDDLAEHTAGDADG